MYMIYNLYDYLLNEFEINSSSDYYIHKKDMLFLLNTHQFS